MRSTPSPKRWLALCALSKRALARGASHPAVNLICWDISGNCTDRYCVNRVERDPLTHRYMEVNVYTRCRHCANCRKAHRYHWARRCENELLLSERTWFCTMTLRPNEQLHVLQLVRQKATSKGQDFDAYSSDHQFRELAREALKLVTRYLKRVRKRSEAKFRYMLVCEPHKSGLPHIHLFIHEGIGTGVVTWRDLSKQWPYGWYNFKLVDKSDTRKSHYLCKYLGKSDGARVRASLGYGATLVHSERVEIDPRTARELD